MIIAVNLTSFIKTAGNELLYTYFVEAAASQPGHTFIFIGARGAMKATVPFKNILHIVSAPLANNPLAWKIWLNYTLPRVVRKHGADIIVHTGSVCSLRTRLPQWLFVGNQPIFTLPRFFSVAEAQFLKKNLGTFISRATTVAAVSHLLVQQLVEKYPEAEKKITELTLTPSNSYQPLGWKEKEAVKEKYTAGKEFFLFSGEVHLHNNLVQLLKAFSFFKKRQQSNMQLVITTSGVSEFGQLVDNFETYKYRNEVIVLMDLPEGELAAITATAYAFVYPVLYEDIPMAPLRAMHCGVPVITTNIPAINEITGDNVLYADPQNFNDIADKMMLIFKDETLRASLINNSKALLEKSNIASVIAAIWKSIAETIGYALPLHP